MFTAAEMALQNLKSGSRRDRVCAKFVEAEFEKIDRLMEVYIVRLPTCPPVTATYLLLHHGKQQSVSSRGWNH